MSVEELFLAFFDNKKRRIQILLWWHVRQPVRGKTIKEVFTNFITTILYEDLFIVMNADKIKLFKNKDGLSISYSSMTKIERSIIYDIYKKKHKLFKNVSFFQDNTWLLSDYKKGKDLLKIHTRREIVRDFVYYVLTKNEKIPDVRWMLTTITQHIIEKKKKRNDIFIRSLHDKLQNIGDINHLLCIY